MKQIKSWTPDEIKFLRKLNTPSKIQSFLDDISYNSIIECRSPRWVIKNRRAHCFEGAMMAAACLQFNGQPPLVVDLLAENDDDHVIAVFQYRKHWGALAMSNCTTLRYREPVYRTLRELVMSYFDLYCNIYGEKSLRKYSVPVNLNRLYGPGWITTDEDLDPLGQRLNDVRHYPLLSTGMIKNLSPLSDMLLKATLLGSNPDGLYKPQKR